MRMVPLGRISDISPRKPRNLNSSEACSFVPMELVDEYSGQIMDARKQSIGEVEKGYTYFADGDVLFAKITPCMENGKCAIAHDLIGGIGFGSTEFHVLRAGDSVIPEWIYYFLRQESVRRLAKRQMTGSAGQQRVPTGFLDKLEIPLPSLTEQQRIADLLSRADRLRRLRRFALEMSDGYLQAVFLEMFGDPVTNPMGWDTAQLKKLKKPGDRINYGVVQPGNDYPGGIPIVRVGDLEDVRKSLDGLKRIDPAIEAKYKRSRLAGDEVLIACVGSIGRVILANPRMKGCNIVRAVTRIPVGDSVNRVFLATYLSTPAVQNYFVAETRTVSQPTLNVKQIEETLIYIPPLERQQQFLIVWQQFDRLRAQQQEALRQAEHLFQTLLHRSFRGA